VLLFATEKERNDTYKEVIKYNNFDVIITSYQGVITCYNWLQKIKWKTMIVDEAHRIKNDEAIISNALRSYSAQFKLLMTGTPLSNDLHELWSLLNFILPEIFHEARVFDDIYSAVESLRGEEKQRLQIEIAEKIHRVLAPFMMRRTKKEVETSLPSKTEMTLYISLTPLQVQMYRNYAKYQNPKGKSIERYKNGQIQMRKICCHPYLFDGIEPENLEDPMPHLIEASGKLIVLDKLLHKLLKEDHKILIFSQFTIMLDILEDYCVYRNYPISRIDGSMPL
jgi:SWI/SNF-related matrix-associated actin-dependent regulator of chromatin subfamily A member 5